MPLGREQEVLGRECRYTKKDYTTFSASKPASASPLSAKADPCY